MTSIRTKRVYEPPEPSDDLRILVDRVWPRGMTKDRLRADAWLKSVAPSTGLRKWFGHEPARWEEFKNRYFVELDQNPEEVAKLTDMLEKGSVTLLYSAKDGEHNQAAALREYLSALVKTRRRPRPRGRSPGH